jgi:hypothetical protein
MTCPPTVSLRRNPVSVTITLSGCRWGSVRSPGVSRYSSTRTRSFSKTTLYRSGLHTVGSWLMAGLQTSVRWILVV